MIMVVLFLRLKEDKNCKDVYGFSYQSKWKSKFSSPESISTVKYFQLTTNYLKIKEAHSSRNDVPSFKYNN